MPYTKHELKIRRIEREISGLMRAIDDLMVTAARKQGRMYGLMDKLKVLKDAEEE